MVSHQPVLPVTGWVLSTCWSPVSAWQTSTALVRSALSAPYVWYAICSGPKSTPASRRSGLFGAKRTTGECGESASRVRSARSSVALASAMSVSRKATPTSVRRPFAGGQRGVNRPVPLGVNVFFAFSLNGTYQSGRLPGQTHAETATPQDTSARRSAARDRSHRRGDARALARTRRDHRHLDRGKEH